MPTFAAIDIGANSVRLKIAQVLRQNLRVIHEDREVTRLGESVFRSGILDPQAIAHTVKTLRRFHKATQSLGADAVRVVATSALRDARNSGAFLNWVRAATGWRVEVISGLEEGRLIHLGVMTQGHPSASRVLLIDLGGGSCEVTTSLDGQIREVHSLPLGAVRLTEEFLRYDPPKKRELRQLREYIAEEVGRIPSRFARNGFQLAIATSGTAAALASLWTARQKRSRAVLSVPRNAIDSIATELAALSLDRRRALPGIGPRRAEIIVSGAFVYGELCHRLQLTSIRYSPLGLRDGVLTQMQAEFRPTTTMRRQVEAERAAATLELARHYGVDLKYAEHVRDTVRRLFTALRPVHRLPQEYEEWLAAAAMLHEVGQFLNRAGRHRHAYYIIAHSELFGYTAQQRYLVAAIARYAGKSRPAEQDYATAALDPANRAFLPKAVVLFRLARALDQGRRRGVESIRVRVREEQVRLTLSAKRGGADLELWSLEKERAYFREVFGRELVAVIEH